MEKHIEMIRKALSYMKDIYDEAESFRLESIRKIEKGTKYEIGISYVVDNSNSIWETNPERITKYITLWADGNFESLTSKPKDEE